MSIYSCDACRIMILDEPGLCRHCRRLPQHVLELVAADSGLTPTAQTARACAEALTDYATGHDMIMPHQADRILGHLRRYIDQADNTARRKEYLEDRYYGVK